MQSKDIPLSFTKENRALIRAGTKTETRRIAKPKYHCPFPYIEHCPGDKYPWYCRDRYGMMDSFRSADELADKCSSYGGNGKPFRYYMKEPVQVLRLHDGDIASGPWAEIMYPDTPDVAPVSVQISGQDYQKLLSRKDWRKPSTGMFMLKSFARTWLTPERLWVEKLSEITVAGAIEEGIEIDPAVCDLDFLSRLAFDVKDKSLNKPVWRDYLSGGYDLLPVQSYASLWNSINGEDAWDDDQWVWCIRFEKEESL